MTLIYILIATFLISCGGFVGVVTLGMHRQKLQQILFILMALAAGTLMGGAFFHLLPEAAEELPGQFLNLTLLSFIVFYLIEKILHWRHCHEQDYETHTFGYMNLLGDAIHNFIDGLVVAAAFLTDINLGIATSVAVVFHEIPQEIGDFGVLLYSGFKVKTALLANVLVACTAILGGLVGYWLSSVSANTIPYLLPIAGGGFLYIATSDLMPELRKENNLKRSALAFVVFLIGLAMMFLLQQIEPEHHEETESTASVPGIEENL